MHEVLGNSASGGIVRLSDFSYLQKKITIVGVPFAMPICQVVRTGSTWVRASAKP